MLIERSGALVFFVALAAAAPSCLADYDSYQLCRRGGINPDISNSNDGYSRYSPAIFRVEEKRSNEQKIRGTATLVSYQGHFITAAHVLRQAEVSNLRVVPSAPNLVTGDYKVKVLRPGTPGTNIENVGNDWALIQAVSWPRKGVDGITPARFRYTGDQQAQAWEVGGWFAGFPEQNNGGIERVPFEPATKKTFHGTVSYGMSGALLVDSYGWGFGIVGAYGGDELANPNRKLTELERRDAFIKAATFGIARIEAQDEWWQDIDPDATLPFSHRSFKGLVSSLSSPSNRQGAKKELEVSFGELDLIKLEYLIKVYNAMKLSEWETSDRGWIISYMNQNAANRCMPLAERTRIIQTQIAGAAVEVGREIYRHAIMGNKPQANERLALAEQLLNKGISDLKERSSWALNSGDPSSYQSGVAQDLAKIQTELAKYGDEDAIFRAKNNLKLAVDLDQNHPSHIETAIAIARAEKDFESEARLTYEKAVTAKVRRTLTVKKEKDLQRDLEYLANEDSQSGGTWGARVAESKARFKWLEVRGHLKELMIPELSHDLTEALGESNAYIPSEPCC